jgi:2-oxoglutarate ferredoxin oxidoreductase subunit beta
LHELRLEHGKPLVFGPPADRRGLVLEGVKPKVVKVADVPASSLWVHDETDGGTALVLAQLWAPAYPIPLGVLASRPGDTTYEDILIQQEQKAVSDRGPGDIAKLLMSGDTWKIG